MNLLISSGYSRTHPYAREQEIAHIPSHKDNSLERLEDNASQNRSHGPVPPGAGQRQIPNRLWERTASSHGPPAKIPLEKSPSHALFRLGTGPRQLLAGSSWALAPVDLAPMLHKHTAPPPSSMLLPDGFSLILSPHFRPFSFSFDFFSLPCFLPKHLLSTAPSCPHHYLSPPLSLIFF